jgi:hypothetical protein
MEPESSLPYSQAPATCPYPEPTPSSPHNSLPLPEDPSKFNISRYFEKSVKKIRFLFKSDEANGRFFVSMQRRTLFMKSYVRFIVAGDINFP